MKNLPLKALLLVIAFSFTFTMTHAHQVHEVNDTIKNEVKEDVNEGQSKTKDHDLGEATVTATRLVFVTKKDTVIYDMDALGATKGDMLQDMVKRMPGLEMKDGALYYRGKVVNRVLVNGTDFQRGDTKKALQNLPAYIIKSVKAYEDKTDQAKITGIDDGTRERVVNVILKKKYLGTWTGNADVGEGTQHRWLYRGFANTFTTHSRVSAYGGFANIGQYQSVSDDGDWNNNGGAGSSSGDTRYMQPGLSFMWNNGKEQNKKGYLMLDGSAGWDYRGHKDKMESKTESFLDDGTGMTRIKREHSKNDERIWNVNLSLTWQPTDGTHIDFRPYYAYTTYEDRSSLKSGLWNGYFDDGSSFLPLDSLLRYPQMGWPAADDVVKANTLTLNETESNRMTHDYGHWLYFTQKLSQNNWRLSLRNQVSYNYSNKKENDLYQYNQFGQTNSPVDPLYNRYSVNNTHNFNLQNFVDLNVPLKFFQTMRFTYGTTITRNHGDTQAYRLERLGGVYANFDAYLLQMGLLPTTADWQSLAQDAERTLNQTTYNRRHWFENQLQYNKHGLIVSMQNTFRLVYDRLDYDKLKYAALHPSRHDNEYYFGLNVRYETDSIGTFTLNYSYNTQNPWLLHTITLPDESDPLNVVLGNADLKKRHDHNLSVGYDRTFKKGQMFSINNTFNFIDNSTTSRSTFNKQTGVTTTQYVNLPHGSFNYSPNLSFSTPLDKKQQCNFSTSLYYQLNKGQTYAIATQGEPELNHQTTHSIYHSLSLMARLGKLQLEGQNMFMFNKSLTTAAHAVPLKSLFNQTRLGVQYTFPFDMVLKSDVQVNRQHQKGSSIQPWRTIWNASITQSFLRNKTLALKLEASDLLNQRSQTWNYVQVTSRSSGWSSTVGRFVMLHVIYRFSTKK